MKKCVLMIMAFVFVLTTSAFAENYVKPEVFKQWLEDKKPVIIVDIQPASEFEKHYFKGSIETNAFPAMAEEEKKRLDAVILKVKGSKDNVVIVCPRGKKGAGNTYDYLKSKGISENRLYILEAGIAGWPYKEMLEKGR
ncbi:MAG: rhodanese-like domain-containing protein [Nitrospirae bacterium]|nr:rhodanese-like domain-containing protein [Nitrospirota bacterium]